MKNVYSEKIGQKIFKLISRKGWALYRRESGQVEEVNEEQEAEEIKRGSVDILELRGIYDILPRVNNPDEKKGLELFLGKYKIFPKVSVPNGGSYCGERVVVLKGKETRLPLYPGLEIICVGIELDHREVRLISTQKCFMTYPLFLKALETLQDITKFQEPK